MKFNRYLPKETRELLEQQYEEYIKSTPMNKKEQRALQEWVKDGHSVYENPYDMWADGQVPVEFLTVFREEEYIHKQTTGLSPEAARSFVLEHYGIDSDESGWISLILDLEPEKDLPF